MGFMDRSLCYWLHSQPRMHCPSASRLQIRVLVRHGADRRPDVTDKLVLLYVATRVHGAETVHFFVVTGDVHLEC